MGPESQCSLRTLEMQDQQVFVRLPFPASLGGVFAGVLFMLWIDRQFSLSALALHAYGKAGKMLVETRYVVAARRPHPLCPSSPAPRRSPRAISH